MCDTNKNSNLASKNGDKIERGVSSVLAYVLICICAVGLICPFVMQVYNHKSEGIVIKVSYQDSIPNSMVYTRSEVDSLFRRIDQKELLLEEKYNYILQQKEQEFKWQSYISLIIGIIVSICGFFGYKSIRDLKEDVQKDTKKWAERAAGEKAKTVATDVTRKVCHTEVTQLMPTEVSSYLDKHLQTSVKQKVDELYKSEMTKALRSELQIYMDMKVDALKNEMNNFNFDADPKISEDNDDSQMFIK